MECDGVGYFQFPAKARPRRVFSISSKGTPDARGSLLMIETVFAHQPKAGN
jgi:hypothetical protein